MTSPAADPAAQLQGLIDLVVNPTQTPEQVASGEYTFLQVRGIVNRQAKELQQMREGAGGAPYDTVKDFVSHYAPRLPKLETAVDELSNKIGTLQQTLEPTLKAAETKMFELGEYAQKSREEHSARVEQLVQATQERFNQLEQQHQALIKHAQDKFDAVEAQQSTFLEGAKTKFHEFENQQMALISDGSHRFAALEAKCARLENLASIVAGMQDADASAIRQRLAESGVRGGRDSTRSISEYRAISALEHYTGEGRLGYKAWTRKLKNAIYQARGEDWRTALDEIELHKVTDDFEELTSVDEKWDEWFEGRFGVMRTDGKPPISLSEFKADLDWILTDKLGDALVLAIRKHRYNGLRGYKKLYLWSVDIIDVVKQQHMGMIMNPQPAKHDHEQAAVIEKWDQDRSDLMQADPKCELKEPFILTSFLQLLTPTFRDFINKQLDPTLRNDYTVVRSRIYAWALRLRLDHKGQGGAMDNLDRSAGDIDFGNDPLTHGRNPDGSGSWGGGQILAGGDANAVGPGKGRFKGSAGSKGQGKGINGQCWTCGQYGHRSAQCPHNAGGKGRPVGKGFPKGKGKGKGLNGVQEEVGPGSSGAWEPMGAGPQPLALIQGQYPGICWGCGEYGHTYRYCRKSNPNAQLLLRSGVSSVEENPASHAVEGSDQVR